MRSHIFKWFILWLAIAGKSLQVGAQTVSVNKPEQDCYGAIRICQTTYSNTNSYTGSGLVPNEINPTYSCLSTGEKNDVWYTFTTHSAGFISFTITPFNIHDDYDWAVFNVTNSSCSNIFSDSTLEVSCNYDANVGCNGVTGANSNFTFCGQTEAVIPVMAGETYLINVSNYSSSQSGYTIDFAAATAQIFDNTPPQVFADTISCNQTLLNMQFDEHIDCNSLELNGSDFFLMDSTGNVITPLSVLINGCDSIRPYITSAQLVLSQPLADHASYFLIVTTGSDSNTVSDLCGNFIAAGDTVSTVHVLNTLSVLLGNDILLCENEAMPTLQEQFSDAPSLQWYLNDSLIASSTHQIFPVDTGEYILNMSYGLQCSTADTLQITYKLDLVFTLGSDTTVCKQNNIPVLSSGITNADSYAWYINGQPASSSTSSYQPISGGIVILTIEKINYCTYSDTVMLTVVNLPEINLGDDNKICEGSAIDLNASLSLTGDYQWFKNDSDINNNSPTLSVTSEGIYKIVFTGDAGCTSSDSVAISTTAIPLAPKVSCPKIKTSGKEFSWEAVNNAAGYEVSCDNSISWTALNSQTLSYLSPAEITTLQVRAVNDGCYSNIAESTSCEEYITTVLLPDFNSFEITGIEYPLQLYVFDGVGKQVLYDGDYKNNWTGPSLKNGIYFYTLRYAKAKYRSGKFLVQR